VDGTGVRAGVARGRAGTVVEQGGGVSIRKIVNQLVQVDGLKPGGFAGCDKEDHPI